MKAAHQSPDAALVRAVRDSADEAAFRVLMERHAPTVAGFLYGKLRFADEAEDLMQEIFLTAFRRLPSLRDPARFAPWLLRIARHKLADHYRTQRLARVPQPAEADGAAYDRAPGPADRAGQAQTAAAMRQAMGRLADKYRVVVYLRLWEERSSREIAAHLGLKESAVRMRLQRGLKKLRKDMERQGISP